MPAVLISTIWGQQQRATCGIKEIIKKLMWASAKTKFKSTKSYRALFLSKFKGIHMKRNTMSKNMISTSSMVVLWMFSNWKTLLIKCSCPVVTGFRRFHGLLARLHIGVPFVRLLVSGVFPICGILVVHSTVRGLSHWPLFSSAVACLPDIALLIVLAMRWFLLQAFGLDRRSFLDKSSYLAAVFAFSMYSMSTMNVIRPLSSGKTTGKWTLIQPTTCRQ